MITVAILINGNPILARSAVNKKKQNNKGEHLYLADSGEKIWHHRDAGAVQLAKQLLELIKSDK